MAQSEQHSTRETYGHWSAKPGRKNASLPRNFILKTQNFEEQELFTENWETKGRVLEFTL